jgi:glutamyl-tRNA reductase
MHTAVMGTDFTKTSLKMRDAVYFSSQKVQEFLHTVPSDAPIYEMVVLSTCNRIEIYFVCDAYETALSWLKHQFAAFHHLPIAMIDKVLFSYRCDEAVRHLFRVAAGCESMVVGEDEILGQIRNAYFFSRDRKKTRSYLNKLFQKAIAVGKKVRATTRISRGSASVSSVAIDSLYDRFGSLDDKRILIVGAGIMSMRAVKRLHHLGPQRVYLANRTEARSRMVAEHYNLSTLPFGDIARHLSYFDIVILATSAQKRIVSLADAAQRHDRAKPLLVLDLGAPRNADPAIASLPNISLLSIDDLRDVSRKVLERRRGEMDEAQHIIEEEVREFTRWYNRKHNLCLDQ